MVYRLSEKYRRHFPRKPFLRVLCNLKIHDKDTAAGLYTDE
jgi:hypothetical protein